MILDVTAGYRGMYKDKLDKGTIFIDCKRNVTPKPDIIAVWAYLPIKSGVVDGGISWLWDLNRSQEKYEKALESENRNSQTYTALKKMLVDATTAGKKGLLLEGKWCFLSTEKDWVGRKPGKDFSSNGGAPK